MPETLMPATDKNENPMNLLAIDPGTHDSAFVLYDGDRPTRFGIMTNIGILGIVHQHDGPIVCEMIQCQGMPVGLETFETAYWIGRYWERAGRIHRMYRSDVKSFLCGSMKAKDSNIRQALIDKWGGKELAIGRAKSPGPLFGISSHCWSALAIAVTFCESEKFKGARMEVAT